MFWLVFVALLVMPKVGWWDTGPDGQTLGYFLLLWGIFTLVMFIGTFKIDRPLQVIFGTLTLLFFLLAAHAFTGIAVIGTIAGWEGIVCGVSAIYTGLSQILGDLNKKPA